MNKALWPRLSLGVFIIMGIAAGIAALPDRQESPGDERLARLLERTGEYCLKLEKAALDFMCLEKIEEKTYRLPEIQPDAAVNMSGQVDGGMSYAYPARQQPYGNRLVYDYQFVRKEGRKTERRILIEDNGRKKREEDAQLTTLTVRVENALFGPIGLLGAEMRPNHDYKIVGEEHPKGKTLVVIEAVPKPALNRPHCYGRIWVQEDDASIVKIAWNQDSVGNFAQVQAVARQLGAEPRLESITEYGLLKNGIRFPSKDTTEEAYLLKNGKTYVRSTTTILYKDYKFFTVETEVKY